MTDAPPEIHAPPAPDVPPAPPWRFLLLLMLLDAAVILPTLGARTLWQIDESRLAVIGHEMAETGDWLIPRIGGQVYACYPPLAYWGIAASGSAFGWNEWSARLPSAMAGVLLVGLAGLLAWRLTASRLATACAAVALATTAGFVSQQTTGRADTMVACFAMAAIVLFDVIVREGARPARLVAFYACIALGILTKGPLAIVLPAAVIGPWIVVRRRWDWIAAMKPWWGLPAVLLAVVPWYVILARAGGGGALTENLFTENVEAFVTGHSHKQPIHFYLLRLPVRALPWFLVLAALPWLPRIRKETLFAALGALATLAFLTASTSKRLNYLAYLYPILSVVEGAALAALLEVPHWRRAAAWGAWALAGAAALGTAALLLPPLSTSEVVQVARAPLAIAGGLVGAAFAGIAVLLRRDRPAAALGTLAATLSGLIVFHGLVLAPRWDSEGLEGKAFGRTVGDRVPPGETIGAIGIETKAFFYFYIPRRMRQIDTAQAFTRSGLRYGFSLEADRPADAVTLATYQGKDQHDPVQALWRLP
jgi:4-amino-4-deoxy-L-arabinose transferase-like glycosyltransferase